MSETQNPLAPHVLPWFVTPPGGTDTLYIITTVIVIFAVVMLGVFFFWLHSLPERMGHKKLQFEIVAVLGLISLFTHMHIFWIMGLLLAVIDLPDFINPLRRIAGATEKIAGLTPDEPPLLPGEPVPHVASEASARLSTPDHA
jgi:hypothetical protein